MNIVIERISIGRILAEKNERNNWIKWWLLLKKFDFPCPFPPITILMLGWRSLRERVSYDLKFRTTILSIQLILCLIWIYSKSRNIGAIIKYLWSSLNYILYYCPVYHSWNANSTLKPCLGSLQNYWMLCQWTCCCQLIPTLHSCSCFQ